MTDLEIHLSVNSTDKERFFEQFGIPTSQERQPADEIAGPLQVVLEPRAQVDAEVIDGRPVIPLSETVVFAREHYATFEPALYMLDRMYEDIETEVDYRSNSMAVPQ
ncbi:MAG TPA: hypothetical protein VFJ06_04940 [Halococcus sp.]|nr:hypothetical protein [Halococcus sp.]